jgi:menaquinone-dependent protoporphyrinogen IX oxidase
MKALVLFRSYHDNTKQVAEAIANELGTQGIEIIVQDLRRKLPDLSDIDFILIGSPTRMAKVNRKALRVLKRLRKKGFTEKPLAIFDTYGPVPTKPEELEKAKKWLYPGAAGIMQNVAKTLGLNVYPETLRCEVRGMKGPLADNELEKATSFAKQFLSKRSPRR